MVTDVDDLKDGKGAEYVDVSVVVLIFASRGYFQSPNWSARAFERRTAHLVAVLQEAAPVDLVYVFMFLI